MRSRLVRRSTFLPRRGLHLTLSPVAMLSLALLMLAFSAAAQTPGTARPELVFSELVSGMPRNEKQQVRVLTASFMPGDRTVFHSHRSPVTVYILEGAFTLELEGRAPITVEAGKAFVEPPNVKMTGYNRNQQAPLKLVIFYVSDPDTPFLDPLN